jgi:hypothetical protein
MIPAISLMRTLGLEPDPWQVEVLETDHPRLLLNCARQGGKSTVVALLGLTQALYVPFTLILLLSASHRQSKELLRTIMSYYARIRNLPGLIKKTAEEIEFANHSRIVTLPCKEETVRGYANVNLVVIDEAARVFDDLYRTVRPMLAVSDGRMICLSTPHGKRGFFYDCWAKGGDDWKRIEVPADQIPRIKAAFLEKERRGLGDAWFRQEYCCSFEALQGLVFPNLATCVVPVPAQPLEGKHKGGIDFGYHAPFAAVWGVLDHAGVLWLTGEHYSRQRPLSQNAACLPKKVTWACDPAGANERAELRCAGFVVLKGNNAIRPGIAAVNGRINSGKLRIVEGACPNLLAEAARHRYSEDPRLSDSETPVDGHNHALDALRYLISRLDAGTLAKPDTPQQGPKPEPKPPKPWLRIDNEALWTPLWP